ncbi:MAG TPA: toll/interleukin-1 receptor domain-containing protein [Ktedonobacteraceae bacterium]|nr:toll/interleukin-1 receptor domain-containing protein [Ktedonobacteraceae bacterium]
MADSKATKILQQGSEAWNQWREERPDIEPDLRKADLHERTLTGINFERTHLDGANLRNANLCSALLKSASLSQADLSGAKLRNAQLCRTLFRETLLQKTNFHHALLLETEFLNIDLSKAINLETSVHLGPSTLGIDTLQRSRGKIPDIFLRGVGVSEQFLTCIHSLGQAHFDYATCFISYSSRDQRFVEILYQDLRKAGVLCWFAPESLKTGEKFPVSITEAVQRHEKVLVVLSQHSLKSDWVKKEVELARQRESGGKREVLLPIRLDGAVLNSDVGWAAAIRRKRNIRSFENWQQPSHYQRMFKALLNDLRKG